MERLLITDYDPDDICFHKKYIIRENCNLDPYVRELEDTHPKLLFGLIFDNPNYENTALRLFDKVISKNLNVLFPIHIYGMFYYTQYGKKVIRERYKEFLELREICVKEVIRCLLIYPQDNMDILKELSVHENLHIRFLFMCALIKDDELNISDFYDDITKYFSYVKDGKLIQMDDKDISKICGLLYDVLPDSTIFKKVKEYIYTNYPKNSLGAEFADDKKTDRFKEFMRDANRMFLTSKCNKVYIYRWYSNCLSKEIREAFGEYIKNFKTQYELSDLDHIYHMALGSKLEELVEKYLSLSKRTDHEFLSRGSTTASFRIGDYCFKLSTTKWSFDDPICPDLYLIIKDLEEIYLRDSNDFVTAGIEVQPYLKKDATHVPKEIESRWTDELRRLGYTYKDYLLKQDCRYDNVRLLDSYKDANCDNPEELPDWFKEYPLVLIDRDMVYKMGKTILRRPTVR